MATTMPKQIQKDDVERCIFREAQLIDDDAFDEWLNIFTDDAIYWIPCNRNDSDPMNQVSIIYDDRQRMEDRVWRLTSGLAYAQEPRSKLCHVIGNMEIKEVLDNEVTVTSKFILLELRKGVTTSFGGRCIHRLRWVDEDWKVCYKKVELLQNNDVIDNMTFLV